MRLFVFSKKFIFYLTIMFLLWIPVSGKYFSSPVLILSPATFFLFYLPLNLIPYIALILATPIDKSKMIRFIFMGSLFIFFFNVFIIMLQLNFVSLRLELYYFYAIGRAAIPFILWFAFTYESILEPELKSETENKAKAVKSSKKVAVADQYQRCSICGMKKIGLAEHIEAVHGKEYLK